MVGRIKIYQAFEEFQVVTDYAPNLNAYTSYDFIIVYLISIHFLDLAQEQFKIHTQILKPERKMLVKPEEKFSF